MQSQNIFYPNLVTFEINNLATNICDKDWGKVALERPRVGEPPVGLGQGMLN